MVKEANNGRFLSTRIENKWKIVIRINFALSIFQP
jgi:hypothetical protein